MFPGACATSSVPVDHRSKQGGNHTTAAHLGGRRTEPEKRIRAVVLFTRIEGKGACSRMAAPNQAMRSGGGVWVSCDIAASGKTRHCEVARQFANKTAASSGYDYGELRNKKNAHVVPLASARQHPENQKENQAGHSTERARWRAKDAKEGSPGTVVASPPIKNSGCLPRRKTQPTNKIVSG